MKKVQSFLKSFIFVELGAFVGKFLAGYMHYRRYPKFYETMSAPWYTEIIFSAIITAVIVAITLIAYIILGNVIKKREVPNEKEETK